MTTERDDTAHNSCYDEHKHNEQADDHPDPPVLRGGLYFLVHLSGVDMPAAQPPRAPLLVFLGGNLARHLLGQRKVPT